MSFLTLRTKERRFVKAERTAGGADLAVASAAETLRSSAPYAWSMACFEAPKLPDATARSTESPTVSELLSSALTARHRVLFVAAPALAVPTGARIMRPAPLMQIPVH